MPAWLLCSIAPGCLATCLNPQPACLPPGLGPVDCGVPQVLAVDCLAVPPAAVLAVLTPLSWSMEVLGCQRDRLLA
jgi:hypothetical protein